MRRFILELITVPIACLWLAAPVLADTPRGGFMPLARTNAESGKSYLPAARFLPLKAVSIRTGEPTPPTALHNPGIRQSTFRPKFAGIRAQPTVHVSRAARSVAAPPPARSVSHNTSAVPSLDAFLADVGGR